MEAGRLGHLDGARKAYERLFKEGYGNQLEAWMALLALERSYGDHSSCVKAYRNAAARVKDSPEYLFDMWLQFEREEGQLADVEDAESRIEKRRAQLAEQQQHAEARAAAEAEEKLQRKQQKQAEKKRKRGGPSDAGPFCKPFFF